MHNAHDKIVMIAISKGQKHLCKRIEKI